MNTNSYTLQMHAFNATLRRPWTPQLWPWCLLMPTSFCLLFLQFFLHPSPDLFEQVFASIVATIFLCNPAVAAQKEY